MQFPNMKIFEDADPKSFSKHNKKHVTEDFVTENFKDIGWRTYRPFNDTGIDLIVKKDVCPNGHTEWNEIEKGNKCEECQAPLIEITRFIQVKTREVKGKNETFGYTLKSKDFRTDPRHVFLFYSDFTEDFIILPMWDYMNIFHKNEDIGKSHFSTPSFRKGNNKLNNLSKTSGKWVWGRSGVDFTPFTNINGIKNLSSTKIEHQFDELNREIQIMKFDLFYRYSRGSKRSPQVSEQIEKEINEWLENFKNMNENEICKLRNTILENLREELPQNLKDSINNGYLVKFKGVEI